MCTIFIARLPFRPGVPDLASSTEYTLTPGEGASGVREANLISMGTMHSTIETVVRSARRATDEILAGSNLG